MARRQLGLTSCLANKGLRMKWLLILVPFAWPVVVQAADISLAWTGHINATHYRMYVSVDNGSSWAQKDGNIPQPDPFPEDAQVNKVFKGIPEDTIVLFRVSAFRGDVEMPTLHNGVWYDHRKSPPRATQLMIK